jgi:hypothetical protein
MHIEKEDWRLEEKKTYPRSGAPEWPETGDGEVDDGGDKERMMLHRLPEIEITGRDGRVVCQCRAAGGARPSDARDERRSREGRRGEEIERGEAGGESETNRTRRRVRRRARGGNEIRVRFSEAGGGRRLI